MMKCVQPAQEQNGTFIDKVRKTATNGERQAVGDDEVRAAWTGQLRKGRPMNKHA
jgi:hypothetical protein